MKIKVAFDYKLFILQRYGGISRYFYNLVNQLSISSEIYPKIFSPLHNNYYINKLNRFNCSGSYFPSLFPKFTRGSELINKVLTFYSIKNFQPNIIHETYYSKTMSILSNTPRVLTVYDFINEIYPRDFVNNDSNIGAKKSSIDRADHIICISQNTQKDLLERYNIAKEKTSVIYLGVDPIFVPKFKKENLKFKKPFILYVGPRSNYKNFNKLILAFSLSKILIKQFDLICFGGGDFSNSELNMFKDLGISSNQLRNINGDDIILANLYKSAALFVYPSLYEGFGIPPLEAMASGCPVICSNSSSIPEVVGNAAKMFNPQSEEDIKHTMENVLLSETKLKEMKIRGLRHYKKFTWENCTKKTSKVYKCLL